MKYIEQLDGSFAGFDTKSETYKQLINLPEYRRPIFLNASNADVKKYIAAQEAKAG